MHPRSRSRSAGLAAGAQRAVWLPLAHLAAVTVAGVLRPHPPAPPRPDQEGLATVVLVPAHDEEDGIGATLASLLATQPPRGGLRVVVVADNCTDATAEAARAAGVEVWERTSEHRGKGPALRWAIDRLLAEPEQPDAVAVVDADSVVDPDLFLRAEARLLAGAPAVQGRYLVSPGSSAGLVSQLVQVASACQSVLRPRGRSRLGAAAKLQGNGMVFRRETLQRVPWEAYGVAEDLEYWLALLRAGLHPVHEPDAGVRAVMPTDEATARVQRGRWEQGRSEAARAHAGPGLRQAAARRDPVLAEAVLSELVFPPLSLLAAVVAGAAALRLRSARRAAVRTGGWQAAVLLAHVLAALRVSGSGPRGYLALAAAPAVVVWKVGLKVRTVVRPDTSWRRTPRDP